jgi:hypothetical protein
MLGIILLIFVVLLLAYGSWPTPAPRQYVYGPNWLVILLVIGLLLYVLGIPLNTVCLIIALIFAIMYMLQFQSPNINLLGGAVTFLILSMLVGAAIPMTWRLPHFTH